MTSPADPSTDQLRARLRETIERAPDEQLRTVAAYFEVAGAGATAEAPPVPDILRKPSEEELETQLRERRENPERVAASLVHERLRRGTL